MESRRIRVMRNPASGRPQHETEVPVEVLNVRVATDSERVLPEAEGGHCLVIERLGTVEVAHGDMDVVYSDDFGHECEDSGLSMPGFGTIMLKYQHISGRKSSCSNSFPRETRHEHPARLRR